MLQIALVRGSASASVQTVTRQSSPASEGVLWRLAARWPLRLGLGPDPFQVRARPVARYSAGPSHSRPARPRARVVRPGPGRCHRDWAAGRGRHNYRVTPLSPASPDQLRLAAIRWHPPSGPYTTPIRSVQRFVPKVDGSEPGLSAAGRPARARAPCG
eukprot:756447-Hanusia_phi.AAC.1